jgi:hypothetical protein
VDQWIIPTKETGQQIAAWLESGADVPPVQTPPRQATAPATTPTPTKATASAEAPQPEKKADNTPPKETGKVGRKTDLYNGYVELCGHPEHAKNAMLLVTEGRSSKDWTEEDMANLELDLKARQKKQAEDLPNVDWNYETPESVREEIPDIDEKLAAQMGIGADPETEPEHKWRPFSPVEKMMEGIKFYFGPDGINYTKKEQNEWISKYFKVERLENLKESELKKVLANLKKKVQANNEAEELRRTA